MIKQNFSFNSRKFYKSKKKTCLTFLFLQTILSIGEIMIHSLSGGELKLNKSYDFAKVEIQEGLEKGRPYWFICPFKDICQNDLVLVPLGQENTPTKALVLRVDKNISEQTSPLPIKRMKKILQKLN